MSAADLPLATVTPLRSAPRRVADRTAHPAGSARTGPAGTPPVRARPDTDVLRRAVTALVLLVDEVAAGRRGFPQLEPLLAPTLLRRLGADLRRQRHRTHRPLQVRSVHLGPATADDVVEASVTVARGGRTTALAVRLERHRGGWRATELTAPEAGFAPVAPSNRDDRRRHRDAFDDAAAEAAGRARLASASHRAGPPGDHAPTTPTPRHDAARSSPDGAPAAGVLVPLRRRRGSA